MTDFRIITEEETNWFRKMCAKRNASFEVGGQIEPITFPETSITFAQVPTKTNASLETKNLSDFEVDLETLDRLRLEM